MERIVQLWTGEEIPMRPCITLGCVVVLLCSCSDDRATPAPTGSNVGSIDRITPNGNPANSSDLEIVHHAQRMLDEGRLIFRYDTFGSEAFWGGALQLHAAIAGENNGGVGPGVSPKTALSVGLKVDTEVLPPSLVRDLKDGKVDLDDPATTLALLKLNAVVGVVAITDRSRSGPITSVGLTCSVCHATVDDSFAPGIGRRRDGWPNRDLNVGAIVSLAPNLRPLLELLGVDEATLKQVLATWGPGCYDAQLDKDGKALRPDGARACTMIPAAYGMAGVNLHTYTGFGSVPYWNAYVAATQLHGSGTFWDLRLGEPAQYPIAAKTGSWNTRGKPDRITAKLAALHFYQLAIPAPKAPAGSYDDAARARGESLFNGKGRCGGCHVPPLFTEPGHNLHLPSEIGIDSFQADRSPTHMYRTTPLAGAWSRKGGYYHDGRFPTLLDVVDHYDAVWSLQLSGDEKQDLVEYVKSL
jgi:hypothetical protein